MTFHLWERVVMVELEIEREHVHKVYSEIAAHFSDTRFKPWPRIAQFLQRQPPGSLIADVGCGNGKYLGVNSQVFMVGSDMCSELVSIGHGRGYEVLTCDCLHMPYRKNQFDGVICIAVIHHLSSESRRLKALTEIARVLRPGGEALIYVWAMEQERKKFDCQDVMVPWHLQPKYTSGGVKTSAEKKAAGVCAEEKAARVCAKRREKRQRKKELKEEQRETTEGKRSLGNDGGGLPGELVDGESVVTPETEKAELETVRDNFEAVTVQSVSVQCRAPQDNPGPGIAVQESSRPQKKCELRAGQEPGTTLEQRAMLDASQLNHSCRDREPNAGLSKVGYTTYQRYYHVFREGELVGLVHRVSELCVQEEFYDHENWCVLAKKVVPRCL